MSTAILETPVHYVTAPLPLLDRPYTAEELLHFPNDWHYELIEGYLRPMMPTGDAHGTCTAKFSAFITIHVLEKGLGDIFAAESGFIIGQNPDTVKAPDFAFVAKDRLTFVRSQRFVPVAPDLVLETRSPSDRKASIQEKIEEWLAAGVRIVLDLDPAKEELHVYRQNAEPVTLSVEDSFVADDLLPGLVLPLRKVFPPT